MKRKKFIPNKILKKIYIGQTNFLKLQMAPSLIYIDSSNDVETMYWLEREVLSTEMAGFLSFHELVEKPEGYQENQQ